MSVFSNQAASPAVISSSATEALTRLGASTDGVRSDGSTNLAKAVTALTNLGDKGFKLIIAPTSTGSVCQLVTDSAENPQGGSCVPTLSDTKPIAALVFDRVGVPGTQQISGIAGIASDAVASIDVVTGGVVHSVTLKNNAFFYEFPSSDLLPSTVRVTLVDGQQIERPLRIVDHVPA